VHQRVEIVRALAQIGKAGHQYDRHARGDHAVVILAECSDHQRADRIAVFSDQEAAIRLIRRGRGIPGVEEPHQHIDAVGGR
jgi:hypothetical protein